MTPLKRLQAKGETSTLQTGKNARACAHMNATLLEQKCDFQSPIAETRIPQKLLAFRAYKNNSAVEGLVRHKPSCYERF